jgi:hypothetical protein
MKNFLMKFVLALINRSFFSSWHEHHGEYIRIDGKDPEIFLPLV